MELNGALWNPLTTDKRLHLDSLKKLKKALERQESCPKRHSQRLPRRQGTVLAAVTAILTSAAGPMPVSAIHASVQGQTGVAVPYSSVKDALATHARGSDRRFRRTRRGCYELS